MRPFSAPLSPLLALALGGPALAQTWWPTEAAPADLSHLVYDAAAQRLLGLVAYPQQTWSFDGSRWRLHQPDGLARGTVQRPTTQLAGYDEARGTAVLVASAVPWTPARTYVSHRGGWRGITPTSTPQVDSPGVAFDPTLNRLLCFGGSAASGWETDAMSAWDGATWTSLQPTTRPSPRVAPAMALDRNRGRVVLFGGHGQFQPPLGDTWEWNGTDWTQFSTSGPSPRSTSLAYDAARQCVVMVGGYDASYLARAETFEWSGSQWLPSGPLPRPMHVLACSDASTVVVGTVRGDLWRRSGTGWTALHRVLRPELYSAARAFEPNGSTLVLREPQVGGGTWTWSGSWQFHSSGGPSGRYGAAMAPYAGGMLLFGGLDAAYLPLWALFDETWHWNGAGWARLQPSQAPTARFEHSLVAAGSTVLLFGGRTIQGESDETWTFQAGAWAQQMSAPAPSPRRQAALAYDAARQRVVLFGGMSQSQLLNDTWEWDGAIWQATTPTLQPPAGIWPMAHTPNGVAMPTDGGGFWTWTGADWLSSTVGSISFGPRLEQAAIGFDVAQQRLRVVDQVGEGHELLVALPLVAGSGSGCGTGPEVRLLGEPRLGSAPLVHCAGASNAAVFTLYGLSAASVPWAPSCFQQAAGDALHFGSTNALGQLDIPFVIPAVTALRGVQVHVQSAVVDGGPVFGASLTGPLTLSIGG